MARIVARLRALLAVLRSRPLPVRIGGAVDAPAFLYPDEGLVLPAISGADGDGEAGEGEGSGGGDPEKGGKPEDEPAKKGGDGEDEEDDENKVTPEDDWKSKARKNERRLKREREAREDAEDKLKKRQEADKSEQEKALDKAREEAREEAKTEAEKERRSDRLEVAVTRLASKGLKVGEGDDAETRRFADTEDALLNVERAISRGDIDESDIFDDEGKVDTEALQTELADLLKRKPHLAAGEAERPTGDPDTRKGGTATTDLEAMSPEDHARRKYGDGKK